MIRTLLVCEKKICLKAFLKLCTDAFCRKLMGKLFHSSHVVTMKVLPPSNLRLNFGYTKLYFAYLVLRERRSLLRV